MTEVDDVEYSKPEKRYYFTQNGKRIGRNYTFNQILFMLIKEINRTIHEKGTFNKT